MQYFQVHVIAIPNSVGHVNSSWNIHVLLLECLTELTPRSSLEMKASSAPVAASICSESLRKSWGGEGSKELYM